MRKWILLICVLLLGYSTVYGQDDFRLTAANVPDLTLFAELRAGYMGAFTWTPDSLRLAIATQGYPGGSTDNQDYHIQRFYQVPYIVIYAMDDLTGEPQMIPLDSTVYNLAFSPDSRYLAAVSYSTDTQRYSLKIWEQTDSTYTALENVSADIQPNVIAFSPDSRLLAYLDEDGWVGVWNVTEGKAEAGGVVNVGASQSIAFTSDNEIAAMGMLSNVYIWEIGADTPRLELDRQLPAGGGGGGERPKTMVVSMELGLIAYEHYDGTLKIANVETGEIIESLPNDGESRAFSMAFNARGTLLATTNTDGSVRIWDVLAIQQKAAGEPSSRELLVTLPNQGGVRVEFSPDNMFMAVRRVSDPALRLYSLPGKRLTPQTAKNMSAMNLVAYCDSLEQTAPAVGNGQPVGVVWSWYATTPELLHDHLFSANYQIAIDTTQVKGWTFLTQVENSVDNSGYPTIYWYTPIPEMLPAGPHSIRYDVSWSSPISDGLAEYGPGTTTETESGQCTFNVG